MRAVVWGPQSALSDGGPLLYRNAIFRSFSSPWNYRMSRLLKRMYLSIYSKQTITGVRSACSCTLSCRCLEYGLRAQLLGEVDEIVSDDVVC